MNQIHVLYEQSGIICKVMGAVSNIEIANKWLDIKPPPKIIDPYTTKSYNGYYSLELDSIELLNEVAKSNPKKDQTNDANQI